MRPAVRTGLLWKIPLTKTSKNKFFFYFQNQPNLIEKMYEQEENEEQEIKKSKNISSIVKFN